MQRAFITLATFLFAANLGAMCNDDPIPTNDLVTADALPILIDVLANDEDPEGQALSFLVTASTCPGTVTTAFDLLRYAPNGTHETPCEITYQLADEAGGTAIGTVRIEPTPEPPFFSDGFETGSANSWSNCEPFCP